MFPCLLKSYHVFLKSGILGSKSVAKYRVIECHNDFPPKNANKIALFTFLWSKLANLITLNRPTKNKAFWKKLIGILDLKYQQFCTFFKYSEIDKKFKR